MSDDDGAEVVRARLEALVEAIPAGILLIGSDHRRLVQNEHFNRMWRLSPELIEGDVVEQMRSAESERELELSDGRVVLRITKPVRDAEGGYHGRLYVFVDITEARRQMALVRHQATHDDLTGLGNARLLAEAVAERCAQADEGGGVAVLLVGLDRFKLVNDGHGHAVGDRLLALVAERLAARAPADATVVRLGGDEFVVFLPDVPDTAAAAAVAGRLTAAIAEPFDVDGVVLQGTASVGIVVAEREGMELGELIDAADIAMFRAKQAGLGLHRVFVEEMKATARERFDVEAALRRAGTEQLALVYQPKLELGSGRIVGVEALMRWTHPTLGTVPPTVFIPIAEESGLIMQLGAWALREACTEARRWNAESATPVTVAVNLSAEQFLTDDIAARVCETLAETGLAPELLELELTESAIARDVDEAVAVFARLRRMGVSVAVDDFGTGYSCFSHLRTFELRTLKIDRSFVAGMTEDAADRSIVRALVDLAHTLGFRVVAEGVERPEELDLLREFGCDEIQGYLLSRPVPVDRLAVLLREHDASAWVRREGHGTR